MQAKLRAEEAKKEAERKAAKEAAEKEATDRKAAEQKIAEEKTERERSSAASNAQGGGRLFSTEYTVVLYVAMISFRVCLFFINDAR